ncbi:MAG TPA: phosphatase PAP2 family protein [Sedimenticola thiotaurini]|uniref:Phosphatase PAP2 family protein n=1 Tax=Sedimenticola thiotaurini TaxID=1543721 RepID=A0A831RL45_9GAMM|nr:phosphatase PAP2 family protein [Sedimenticola thiotaurini]
METYFHAILAWVALHPWFSGGIVFLVAMAESLAIVGMLVPGVAIMFGIGALVAADAIPFWWAMGWAVAGAVAGDGFSFWLGRHYRHRLTTIWPFTRHPGTLERGIAFFRRYGGKSVAIGRFFGPVRAVIPLVAGMMAMNPWRFVVANVLSALAWAPAYLLPGMVFGASLELASEVAVRLVALLLLLLLVLWLAGWLGHRVFLFLQPHSHALVQRLLRWGRDHPRARAITLALADPDHPETRGMILLASLLLLATGLFSLVLGWVLGVGRHHQGVDGAVLDGLQALRTPWADHLMVVFTGLADLEVILPLFLVVLGYLLWRRQRPGALHWLAAGAFCLVAVPLLKHGFGISRPGVVAGTAGSYAFPSGHTLWAVVIYGYLSVMVARATPSRWRWLPYSLAAMLVLAVALSRLYLGVHWLSDVLGSLTLGLAWVAALGIAYYRHCDGERRALPLSLVAGTTLAAAVLLQGLTLHQQKLAFYTPRPEVTQMPASVWWQQGWSSLPRLRDDLWNRRQQPLQLQYAGSPEALAGQLAAAGWKQAERLGWHNLLKLLTPSLPLQQLPVLPHVHDGSHERLVLVRPLQDGTRLVLRLWAGGVRLTPDGVPLWLGRVAQERKKGILGMVAYPTAIPAADPLALQWLQRDLTGRLPLRRVADGLLLVHRPGLLTAPD